MKRWLKQTTIAFLGVGALCVAWATSPTDYTQIEPSVLARSPQTAWARSVLFTDTVTAPLAAHSKRLNRKEYFELGLATAGTVWVPESARAAFEDLPMGQPLSFGGTVDNFSRRYYILVDRVFPLQTSESLQDHWNGMANETPGDADPVMQDLLIQAQNRLIRMAEEQGVTVAQLVGGQTDGGKRIAEIIVGETLQAQMREKNQTAEQVMIDSVVALLQRNALLEDPDGTAGAVPEDAEGLWVAPPPDEVAPAPLPEPEPPQPDPDMDWWTADVPETAPEDIPSEIPSDGTTEVVADIPDGADASVEEVAADGVQLVEGLEDGEPTIGDVPPVEDLAATGNVDVAEAVPGDINESFDPFDLSDTIFENSSESGFDAATTDASADSGEVPFDVPEVADSDIPALPDAQDTMDTIESADAGESAVPAFPDEDVSEAPGTDDVFDFDAIPETDTAKGSDVPDGDATGMEVAADVEPVAGAEPAAPVLFVSSMGGSGLVPRVSTAPTQAELEAAARAAEEEAKRQKEEAKRLEREMEEQAKQREKERRAAEAEAERLEKEARKAERARLEAEERAREEAEREAEKARRAAEKQAAREEAARREAIEAQQAAAVEAARHADRIRALLEKREQEKAANDQALADLAARRAAAEETLRTVQEARDSAVSQIQEAAREAAAAENAQFEQSGKEARDRFEQELAEAREIAENEQQAFDDAQTRLRELEAQVAENRERLDAEERAVRDLEKAARNAEKERARAEETARDAARDAEKARQREQKRAAEAAEEERQAKLEAERRAAQEAARERERAEAAAARQEAERREQEEQAASLQSRRNAAQATLDAAQAPIADPAVETPAEQPAPLSAAERRAAEKERRRLEREARLEAERQAKAEEEARKEAERQAKREDEARRKAEEEAKRAAAREAAKPAPSAWDDWDSPVVW